METCSICLEDCGGALGARALVCGHAFHDGCIERWLSRRTTCPLCRMNVLQRSAATYVVDAWLSRTAAPCEDVNILLPEIRCVLERSLALFGAKASLCTGYVSDQGAGRLTLYVRAPSVVERSSEEVTTVLVDRLRRVVRTEPDVTVAVLQA